MNGHTILPQFVIEISDEKSGEPYIIHPIQVAGILADLHMDPETVCAGYLHDIVEDTGATLDDIKELFAQPLL